MSIDLPGGSGFPKSHDDSGQALRKLAGLFPLTGNNIANATVTDDNLASPNNSTYKTIATGSATWGLDQASASILLTTHGTAALGHTSGAAIAAAGNTKITDIIDLNSADYAVAGKTTRLRVRGQVACNATAPGINFTIGLSTLTVAGAADNLAFTTAAAVGVNASVTTPAASTITRAAGTDFDFPANGAYCLFAFTSAAIANNSLVQISAQLQVRNT